MTATDYSACGCCEGVRTATPVAILNPPGLIALAGRVGTHGRFVESMHAALSADPTFARLTTRDRDDAVIAMTDAWACVLDILTFYQERIANEGYLRTATERRSLLELARAIGYEPSPGVAASTVLAFTCDDAPGAVPSTIIAAGSKAQSIPLAGQTSQVYETIEEIEARPEWNALRPPAKETLTPRRGDTEVYLSGLVSTLSAGDAVLIVGDERLASYSSERWDFRRIVSVTAVPAVEPTPGRIVVPAYTIVTLDRPLGSEDPVVDPAEKTPRFYVLRQRASVFGHSAPPWSVLPVALRIGEQHPTTAGELVEGPYADREDSWADAAFPAGTTEINLDQVYPRIATDSWIVLEKPGYAELFRVTEVAEENKADFMITAKTTRLTIEGEHIHSYSPKLAAVFGQSEEMAFGERPITTPVSGSRVTLDSAVEGLERGRLLVVIGQTVDADGVATGESATEVATLDELDQSGDTTTLVLAADLANRYDPASMSINANAAHATHGERRLPFTPGQTTPSEIIGSGDASATFQEFKLSQSPLTYTAAATASGAASTLEVRVAGVEYTEAASLVDAGPADRVYTVRIDDDGAVWVRFGDGVTGARLPTGDHNIVATYRVGLGLAGESDAGQISLLLSQALGLRSVVNPVAATGGADAQTADELRVNGPASVLTMGRVVSRQDFQDFARSFAGVGKAVAIELWAGERRTVHVTVASASGEALTDSSDLLTNLRRAIDQSRDPEHQIWVQDYAPRAFGVRLRVAPDPERLAEDVIDAVRAALLSAFAYEARDFGLEVTVSEVLAITQRTIGVVGAALDELYFVEGDTPDPMRLRPLAARLVNGSPQPAELAFVDPEQIFITEMTA